MFLRSKIQEMILKRRSRSMNGASAQQQGHVSLDQLATTTPSTIRYDNSGNSGSGGGGSGSGSALFVASPRLLHSSSLPAGSVVVFGKNPAPPDAESVETTTAFSASPISVLDATASFASGGIGRRRPWREGVHGLADALDCTDEQRERSVVLAATSPSLVRSCSLDRRVEFGVKNKSSWLPLREKTAAAASLSSSEPGETGSTIEPSSEDYTCVICRGPNPRTVHIFGDRVVEGGAARESFLSL